MSLNSLFEIEVTEAQRSHIHLPGHTINMVQSWGPHESPDTLFLILWLDCALLQGLWRFIKLTPLHGNEWLDTNLTMLIKFYFLLTPDQKVIARDAEPISVAQTGSYLTYSLESAVWLCSDPNSPACVNLMWILKWSLMVSRSGMCVANRIFLTCFYYGNHGVTRLGLCHHLSSGKQCAQWPFLPQWFFEPQWNLLICRQLKAATPWFFPGVFSC